MLVMLLLQPRGGHSPELSIHLTSPNPNIMTSIKSCCRLGGIVTGTLLLAVTCGAQIVRIGPGSFTPQASVITFSEQAYGTVNPVYSLATASLGTVGVSFGPRFVGQGLDGTSVVTITGTPTAGPLALDLSSNNTSIVDDGANPNSPVLSGSPTFNGPVSVLFSTDVAFVALDGGYFDGLSGTSIEAFDAAGASLGSVTNSELGIEFFGLSTLSGLNTIRGISFYITGDEPYGFAIDNLTFGSAGELSGAVPEPSTYGLMAAGALVALVSFRRRFGRKN